MKLGEAISSSLSLVKVLEMTSRVVDDIPKGGKQEKKENVHYSL